MSKKLSIVALLLLIPTAAAASNVSGTVSNAATNTALPSMFVQAYDTSGTLQGSATTDSAGHYLLQIQPGNYRLLAFDPSGAFATTFNGNSDSFDTSPVVAAGSQPIVLDFALQIGGRVSGTISVANGLPLAATAAAYNLSGTRRGFAQSDSTGAYSIVLPPGQYKLVAYDASGFFAPRFYPDVYGFDSASAVTVTSGSVTPGRNIDLEPAAHLGGTVVDFDTGASLAGTIVYAYDDEGIKIAQVTADDNGHFVVNVPGGAYRLVATDRNLIFATGFLGDTESFDQSLAVSVVASQSRLDLQIPLHRGGMIAGHVTATTGARLPNISVAAYNADGSQRTATQTDSSGAYTLVLPSGDFRIGAYDTQLTYATEFYASKDAFAAASHVNVEPSATNGTVDFALTHAGKIGGTVTESGSDLPAFSVGVAAYDADTDLVNTTTTSAAGAYTLLLPPGSYKIVAFDPALRYATAYGGGMPNYDAASVFTLNSDETELLNFTVSRGIRVSGSVADRQNRPLSGIEIGALDLAGNRVATALGAQGGFTLVLLPGSYKMLASDPSGHYSNLYYSGAATLAGAQTLVVQTGTPPPAVAFVMGNPPRRRAVAP